jgi:hypothetical protein
LVQMHLVMYLSGSRLPLLLDEIRREGLLDQARPSTLSVDFEVREVTSDWFARWVPDCRKELRAGWGAPGPAQQFLRYYPGRIVGLGVKAPRDPAWVLDLLSRLSFELASFDSLHEAWFEVGQDYIAPTFGRMHLPHGWACAFKGAGHDQLVSRRWLDFGPWRVLYGADDATLVQFHDLSADAGGALAQARPAHERMGISEGGGFIQRDYHYAYGVQGFYSADERLLKIVVHGRDVSQREMLDMCAARRYQAIGPDKPLERIGYVFVEEHVARRHLHELWLRELECWAIVAGREVRLDVEYHPSPQRPAWASDIG